MYPRVSYFSPVSSKIPCFQSGTRMSSCVNVRGFFDRGVKRTPFVRPVPGVRVYPCGGYFLVVYNYGEGGFTPPWIQPIRPGWTLSLPRGVPHPGYPPHQTWLGDPIPGQEVPHRGYPHQTWLGYPPSNLARVPLPSAPGWGTPQLDLAGIPPPPAPHVDRQTDGRTDTCQNITFPRTTYAVGKKNQILRTVHSLFMTSLPFHAVTFSCRSADLPGLVLISFILRKTFLMSPGSISSAGLRERAPLSFSEQKIHSILTIVCLEAFAKILICFSIVSRRNRFCDHIFGDCVRPNFGAHFRL